MIWFALLGLNHESDVANSLVFHKNDGASEQELQQQNLKSILMKLTQGEEVNQKWPSRRNKR